VRKCLVGVSWLVPPVMAKIHKPCPAQLTSPPATQLYVRPLSCNRVVQLHTAPADFPTKTQPCAIMAAALWCTQPHSHLTSHADTKT
jgi:hypothetical protein